MSPRSISVITPVFNRENCIGNCISSVANQMAPGGWTVEHVIVDDASTDRTSVLISQAVREGKNIKAVTLEKNSGPNTARNRGISIASGSWVLFLDSDDVLADDALQIICNTIDNFPQYSHFLFVTNDTMRLRLNLPEKKVLTFNDFLLQNISGDFTHVLQRSTLITHPFGEDFRIHEGIFFLRLYKQAGNILFSKKIVVNRDRHRTDHVTQELHLVNDKSLETKIRALSYQLDEYHSDYSNTAKGRELELQILSKIYALSVFKGDDKEADRIYQQISPTDASGILFYRALHLSGLGHAAWSVLSRFNYLRHYVLIKLKHCAHI